MKKFLSIIILVTLIIGNVMFLTLLAILCRVIFFLKSKR